MQQGLGFCERNYSGKTDSYLNRLFFKDIVTLERHAACHGMGTVSLEKQKEGIVIEKL